MNRFDRTKKNSRHQQDYDTMPRKKKRLGQHFLRKQSVVDHMIEKVSIHSSTTVMEIGCGDGFLTAAILQTPCKQLLVYEIDHEWIEYVKARLHDQRLHILHKNILEINFETELNHYKPLVLLANLPYQITFPILFLLQKNKHLFQEGVVMVQEEVAQKIVARDGKGYSATSLFLQYHFDWQLLEKIEPGAFNPPPKVYSRLLYFKPKTVLEEIPEEELFWKFLKLCFRSPGQTLKNNLRTTHYAIDVLSPELFKLRARQISFEQFLEIWKVFIEK